MRARSLLLAVLLISGLAACDKKVLREHVCSRQTPCSNGGSSRPLPDLDGSVVIDEPLEDAGAGADAEDEDAAIAEPEDAATDAEHEPSQPAFSKANLLAAVADCTLSTLRAFEQRAGALTQATSAWAEDPTDANATQARAAFRAAMAAFQRVEAFRFGPLAPANEPGGKGLRDQVYSYPHNNLCKVDQLIVDQLYQRPEFASSVITGRGLAALEYLEYYIGAQNACSSSITINVDGSWAALSASELKTRRAAYAAAVAHDIDVRAKAILAAFDADGDDFVAQLKSAGSGSSVYASEQAALNAISNALFYVEIEVKDYKLALPLGISPDCTSGSTCPETVESPFARLSTANMRENLAAFRAIFQGCGTGHAGLGFDDWLVAAGQPELADEMLAALEGAQRAIDDLGQPLEQVLAQDASKARGAYDALKRLTDLLKTRFVGVLNLELPRVAEGDND